MRETNFLTAINNLKNNFLLLLSSMAALCLFLSPTFACLVVTTAIFAFILLTASLDLTKPPILETKFLKRLSIIFTLLVIFIGYFTFKTNWILSEEALTIGNILHLNDSMLVLILNILDIIGCIVGFYAIYVLFCWIIAYSYKFLREELLTQERNKINWYFSISALAFFTLNINFTIECLIGLFITFIASIIISIHITPPLHQRTVVKTHVEYIKIYIISVLTALGICWYVEERFYAKYKLPSKIKDIEAMFPISIDISKMISICLAITSIFFVYVCVSIFWKELTKIFSQLKTFNQIKKIEWMIYGILLISNLIFMIIAFMQTEAFYGTKYGYDIIYTSDSAKLIKNNVYLTLLHTENDLRQPLFAVFAAPFIGIPYLIGKIFSANQTIQAILLNSIQLIMLFAANFMLTRILKLNPKKRICFMLLLSCTYTQLLFTLMMEQYIVAYFWLIFCIYLITEKQQPNRIALWGATGTLLTSVVLFPSMSEKSPIKDFKHWFIDMIKYGLEFVGLMLVFCRFDIIFNLARKISFFRQFTGNATTWRSKIYQYFEFIHNCWISPNAGINTTATDHISWQLNTINNLNIISIIILLLVIISAIWNQKKKSSCIAVSWIAFSFILLVIVGWGTNENGLILYSLYFAWAFFVLLFQLIEKMEEKLNVKFIIPIVSILGTFVLLLYNIPAITEMVNFAITYFPV